MKENAGALFKPGQEVLSLNPWIILTLRKNEAEAASKGLLPKTIPMAKNKNRREVFSCH